LNAQFIELKAEDCESRFFRQATDLLSENFKGPKEYGPKEIFISLQSGLFRLIVVILPDMDNPGFHTVAGAALVTLYFDQKAMHLEYLAVSNRFQGLGLGKLFMQWLLNYGNQTEELGKKEREDLPNHQTNEKLNLVILTLECKSDLLSFYQRLGAQDSGITQTWQIDYGSGDLLTRTHHFLYFLLDQRSELLVTEVQKELQRCYNFMEELLTSTKLSEACGRIPYPTSLLLDLPQPQICC